MERIHNRYVASTSDSARIDKAPVSSASRRSVSSDVSPLFFLEPANQYPGYVLFMALDRSPRNETDSFFDASGQRARRGNLFDTLYANSAPIASSNSARNGAATISNSNPPLSSRNNFFDYATPMLPSLDKSSYQILFVAAREFKRDSRFRIPFGNFVRTDAPRNAG